MEASDTVSKLFYMLKVLLKSSSVPLYSLGKGKYYRQDDKLQLDVGAFAAALEFASERRALVCGKPDPSFFRAGLSSLGLEAKIGRAHV